MAPVRLRVLAIEPFYGGSHRRFLDQWARRSRHDFTVVGLPATKWKWRMRQSAPVMAREIGRRHEAGERWDVIFCSDMLDLAALRGLSPAICGPLPAVLYFHENQLTYPVRHEQERDLHFAVTNVTSALAADELWFNSHFHRREMLASLPALLRRMPGRELAWCEPVIAERACVQHPGVTDPHTHGAGREDAPLHVVWSARWEFDKDPETFFRAVGHLARADRGGGGFEISVLGQRFREEPPAFGEARERFADRIRAWGHVDDREDYFSVLRSADVWVSTAVHEFFGLSAVEAMLAGAYPLLPDRLSYPELLEPLGDVARRHLYGGGATTLGRRLTRLLEARGSGELERAPARSAAERFRWRERAPAMDEALGSVVRKSRAGARDSRRGAGARTYSPH